MFMSDILSGICSDGIFGVLRATKRHKCTVYRQLSNMFSVFFALVCLFRSYLIHKRTDLLNYLWHKLSIGGRIFEHILYGFRWNSNDDDQSILSFVWLKTLQHSSYF